MSVYEAALALLLIAVITSIGMGYTYNELPVIRILGT
jgi:hypothetical protein